MKNTLSILFVFILILSCTKDPIELITGSWEERNTAFIYTFMEDGTYVWQSPDPGIDPNAGQGLFKIREDSLGLMETGMTCFAYTVWYQFQVDSKELQLTHLNSGDVMIFSRK